MTDSVKKAGIYRTFEEFKNNNPSIIIDFINSTYKIERDERKYGNIGNRNTAYAYGLSCDYRAAENIGAIFGFCDGINIYISFENGQLPNYSSFYKIEYLNRYSYLDFVSTSYIGVSSLYLEKLATKVIDLKTGKFSNLNKSFIKKIISDNLELSKKFELQEVKGEHLKQYLIDYLKQ